ncbi:hypothetical protein RPB_3311 [Rhodopseudomonas palustris HaA2]|uniref:DNA primase/polymerase bifunctional N-terminal domain-containing protein n=1 Tax=Rhodopseudomonas palustris (strain HaA2) TaxID=316058 RepID=Q2IUV3_RHOP2|nr:bifunctional DNA primase/polymerase [Rhodopseudomonas palustris]ABD08007.1 hypothetical protein RPB_3311 [Rhodopseudomonas palustris HaA2]
MLAIRDVFDRLIANGCSPLPIGPRSADPRGPQGKSPARIRSNARGEPIWFHFKKWETFCDRQPHRFAFTAELRDPECGIGIACGFNNLVAVDIDRDDLIEPLLAVLPPMVVAKRGRKGLTVFYRGAEHWPKANYTGFLDFIARGAQTVLPPTIHPDTGQPYAWTTERTLLDTPVEELPLLTADHRKAMEAVLAAHGWQPKEDRQARTAVTAARSSAHSAVSDYFALSDAVNSAALANIGAWAPALNLPKGHWQGTAYRGVAHWRNSGSGRDSAARQPNLSISPTGIRDFGDDRGYTATAVVHFALGLPWLDAEEWLCERLGIEVPPPIILTNGSGDGRVTLPQAEAAVGEAIADFFASAPAAIRAKRDYEGRRTLASMGLGRPPLWVPAMPVSVLKVETGIGKTFGLLDALAEMKGRIAVAVPNHGLAEQTVADLRARGVNAEVYRGYDAQDPQSPGHAMCRNPAALKAAQALSVSVRKTVCVADGGEVKRCPFADECGAERQRKLTARVWVFPSVMLTNQRPDFIADFDALVIDEGFIDNCIAAPVTIPVASLVGSIDGPYNAIERAALHRGRQWLVSAAMKMCEVGGVWLSRASLDAGEIDAEHAGWLADLELRRITAGDLTPGMSPAAMRKTVARRGAENKASRALSDLWREVEAFHLEGHDLSGRIRIENGAITVTALRPVHPDWHLPTLVLDATPPPDLSLLDIAFGAPDATARIVADVLAKWPKHVEVRQLLGATVSKNGLGLRPGMEPATRNIRDLLRRVRVLAAEAAPARIGIIAQKALLDYIRDDLPPNVIPLHFGKLAGMNNMRNVAGLVVIGRQAPWPANVEREAGVWLGYPVEPTGFENVRAKVGGRTVTVNRHRHPLVDALRWLVTDAGLLQAVGRLRPHRRSRPCWLEIINDVVLDLPSVVATDWSPPGAVADMMAAGVVLTNKRDAMAMFGVSDWEARSIGGVVEVGLESLLENPYRDSNPTSPKQPKGSGEDTNRGRRAPAKTRRVIYRKVGPGQKVNQALILPYVIPGGEKAVREVLESKLGIDLASLEIERVLAKDSAYGRTILANCWRLVADIETEPDASEAD